MVLNVANPSINNMTIISCITNKPTLSLPDVVSSSSLSARILRTTMVLLNENQIQIYAAVIGSKPRSIAVHQPNTEHKNTWRIDAIIDDLPSSLMILGFNSIPTINNRKLIPRFPNDSKLAFPCNNVGKIRLIAVPARIYQIIIGCFKTFMIPRETKTTHITSDNARNICSDI